MFVILSAVGLPVTDISLLFTVDWLIDRVRTALNVLGDAFCSCVVQHFMRNDLTPHSVLADLRLDGDGGLEEPDRPAHLLETGGAAKRVSFADYHHIPSPTAPPVFNSAKTYSLKSAIIEPLRAHVALQTRLSQLSEE